MTVWKFPYPLTNRPGLEVMEDDVHVVVKLLEGSVAPKFMSKSSR